jgi:hypothetical protein
MAYSEVGSVQKREVGAGAVCNYTIRNVVR